MSDIITSLQKQIAQQPYFSVGQFRFINLDLVELQAGGAWQTVRRNAFSLSSKHIQGRLGPDDMLLRCSDGFLVIFSETDATLTDRLSKDIARNLNTIFNRDPNLQGFELRAAARAVARNDLSSVLAATLRIDEVVSGGSIADEDSQSHSDWQFSPIWDAELEVIVSNLVLTRDGRCRSAEGIARDLERSCEILQTSQEGGQTVAISMPVDFEAFSTPGGNAGLSRALKSVKPELCEHLQIVFDGLDAGTTPRQIADAIAPIIELGHPVAVVLPMDHVGIQSIARLGVSCIGLRWPGEETMSVYENMRRAVSAARRAIMPVALLGVDQPDVVRQAIAAGVKLLSGPSVSSPGPQPVAMCVIRRNLVLNPRKA